MFGCSLVLDVVFYRIGTSPWSLRCNFWKYYEFLPLLILLSDSTCILFIIGQLLLIIFVVQQTRLFKMTLLFFWDICKLHHLTSNHALHVLINFKPYWFHYIMRFFVLRWLFDFEFIGLVTLLLSAFFEFNNGGMGINRLTFMMVICMLSIKQYLDWPDV